MPLSKVSEENIEPLVGQAPRTKFSLKRTAGRLDNATVQELMEEANYQSLEQAYETIVRTPDTEKNIVLSDFIRDLSVMSRSGSEPIAAVLEEDYEYLNEISRKAYQFEDESKETQFEQVKEAQEVIKKITNDSLENFPEYIVVYRGGNIQDQYNVIPVTTSKEVANSFSNYKEKMGNDLVLQEFLIPKSKVLANMNALQVKKEDINFGPINTNRSYTYAPEMELIVNREDLVISGIDRVPEIEVKKIHERIKKEKLKGEENTREFIQQELLGLGGLKAS